VDLLDAEETPDPKERLESTARLELTERQETRVTKDTKAFLECLDLRALWENKDVPDPVDHLDPEVPTVTVAPLVLMENPAVMVLKDPLAPEDPLERMDAEAEVVRLDKLDPRAPQARVCTPAR